MRDWVRRHRRDVLLMLVGAMVAATFITPAGAHISDSVSHLWDQHVKSLVEQDFYTKQQSNNRYQSKRVLGSGQSQSGAFSAAAGNSTGAAGWLGVGITYEQPLAAPIDNNNIVDVRDASAPNCPGIGQAAPGYLCLYNTITSGVDPAYMYSEESYVNGRIGVVIYFPVNGDQPYVGGTYTVTAP